MLQHCFFFMLWFFFFFLAASNVESKLPDQGSNPHLLHWQVKSYPLNCQGSPSSAVLTTKSWPWCSPLTVFQLQEMRASSCTTTGPHHIPVSLPLLSPSPALGIPPSFYSSGGSLPTAMAQQ